MKKLLKISALALAMSAVLFSCANSSNSTTTPEAPEAPKAETVNPAEIAKPEGYTPSTGAKAVTTKEEAEAAVNSIKASKYTLDPTITSAKESLNEKTIPAETEIETFEYETMYNMQTPHDEKLNVSVPAETVNLTNGTYELKKLEGVGHSKLEITETLISLDNLLKTTNESKTSLKSNDFGNIKSYESNETYYTDIVMTGTATQEDIQNQNMDVVTGKQIYGRSYSTAFLFDNGTYNGILIINETYSYDQMKKEKATIEELKNKDSKYFDVLTKENNHEDPTPEESKLLNEFYETKCGSTYTYSAVFYDVDGKNPFEYAKATKPSEENDIPKDIKNLM